MFEEMKTLIISGYGVSVRFSKGALVLSKGKKKSTYSLADIDQVLLATSGISVTSKALRALINSGVDLVVIDSRGYPIGRLYHPYITRTVDSRRGQYLAYMDERAVKVAKSIVISKLLNQAGMLRRAARNYGIHWLREDITELKAIANEVRKLPETDINDLRKELIRLEAWAARTYWGAYSALLPKDLDFRGRDQAGDDQVNKALNYGYGILYSECWKAAVLAGLDPYAGFIHVDRSGKPTLTFDIIEVFRAAAVDYQLLKAFKSGWRIKISNGVIEPKFRGDIIKIVEAGLESKFKVGDRSKELRGWIRTFAYGLATFFREEAPIKPLVFRW
jgi:CRISPR-associated protein Cas1